MFQAILEQVKYNKEVYTTDMLRKQTALYMLQNPNVFFDYVSHHLLEDDESYESYIYNIFWGDTWGNQLCAAAVSHMWNVSISIVSPLYFKLVKLVHDVQFPHIILVANGGDPTSEIPCTHFSVTKINVPHPVLPGNTLEFKYTIPRKLHDVQKTTKNAKKWASKLTRDEAVTKFKSITKQADYVKDEMKKCEERFKELGGMQDKIGYVLKELGAKLKVLH